MSHSDAPTRLLDEEEKSESNYHSAWTDPPPVNSDADPLIGTTLSRTYVIQRVLGEGGMGRVYEAWHTRIRKKRYAIKVLHPELARNQDVRTRFQREAEAAACVSHPSAVGVYDVALTPQGWPYLVCEFLEGIDLSQYLKDHSALSEVTARWVALQVCDALVEAHSGGVVHRDLKPQNVFLVGDFKDGVPERPTAKVLDFGLSRFLDGSDTELTKTGVIMGTPSYMAPEQARGERVDHLADVYGVGVLLYTAVVGRAPFRGETPQAVLLAVMSTEPARPRSLNPAVSPGLELVIQRAMAKDPKDRYPDMRSLRDALAALESSTSSSNRREDLAVTSGASIISSRRSIPEDSGRASNARMQLVLVGALALAILIAGLSTAIAAGVQLSFGGWPLSRAETVLSLLIVVGTLFSPSLLWLQRVRKKIWDNTARVVELLERLRIVVLSALLAYGASIVGVLFWDQIAARVAGVKTDLPGGTVSWPGLPIALFIAAGIVVVAQSFSAKLLSRDGWVQRTKSSGVRRRRRFVAGPLLHTTGAALASLVLALAVAWSSGRTSWRQLWDGGASAHAQDLDPTLVAVAPSLGVAQRDAGVQVAAVPKVEGNAVKPIPAVVDAGAELALKKTAVPDPAELAVANREELSAAVSQGLDGLLPLLERYPNDARVLRAVGVAQAATSSGLSQAINTFAKLFAVAPSAVEDSDLQHMILQITRKRGAAKRKAYELLALGMGSVGPDLLYKLSLSQPKQRDEALRYLARANVRSKFSPALSIAYDLHFAPSCAARVPLLQRAVQFGDERSIKVLAPLATGKRKGCGYKGRKPCRAVCAKEAQQFMNAVDLISARLIENR